MSAVSYANVVANGSANPSPASSNPSSTPASNGTSSVQSPVPATTSAVSSADDVKSEVSEDKGDQSQKPEEKSKPKDKKLAPAPVPATSAWGNVTKSASSNTLNFDQHKWPTPHQQPAKQPQAAKPQKFTKPSSTSTKWVPINAKVILPSSRPQNQSNNKKNNKKNNNVKNNKNKKNGTPAATANGAGHAGATKARKDRKDEGKPEDVASEFEDLSVQDAPQTESQVGNGEAAEQDVSADAKRDVTGESQSADANGSTVTEQTEASTTSNHNNQHSQTHGENGSASNNGQQYYNNNNHSHNNRQYKVNYRNNNRYSLPNGSPNPNANHYGQNYMQFSPYPQGLPNSYYPYPQAPIQPFNMGAPVPGFNPYPQQFPIQNIPPPITAKQDPVSALTQQIDYYFSFENLIKDVYLRKSFNKDTGFVAISNILSFKRVQLILNQIKNLNLNKEYDEIIKDAIRSCNNIEINDNEDLNKIEIRVKNDYKKFILD